MTRRLALPSKLQSRGGGTRAGTAEVVFARFSFGASFSLPSPGELGAAVAGHTFGSHGTSPGPSLGTGGLLLNSRGIHCLHLFIRRKHI